MSAPYRLTARPLDDETIAARNLAERRTGRTAFPPPTEALTAVASITSVLSPLLDMLVAHPDERVRVAVAGLPVLQKAPGTAATAARRRVRSAHLVATLMEGAVREADAEGLSWTPALDAVLALGNDPRWPHATEVEPLTRRLDDMRPWLSTAASPSDIEALLEARARPVLRAVAQAAPHLSGPTVARLLERHPAVAVDILSSPDRLDDRGMAQFGAALLRCVTEANAANVVEAERTLAAFADAMLAPGAPPLDAEIVATLGTCVTAPHADPRSPVPRLALRALMCHPHTPTAVLSGMSEALLRNHERFESGDEYYLIDSDVIEFGSHPNATTALWVGMLETVVGDRKLLEIRDLVMMGLQLGARSKADPTVRAFLLEHGDENRLRQMGAEPASPEEAAAIIRRLASRPSVGLSDGLDLIEVIEAVATQLPAALDLVSWSDIPDIEQRALEHPRAARSYHLIPAVRTHPGMALRLLTTANGDRTATEALVPLLSDRELVRYFRHLLTSDRTHLLAAELAGHPRLAGRLAPALLLPLFESPDPQVRQTVLVASAHAGHGVESPAPAARARRARQT